MAISERCVPPPISRVTAVTASALKARKGSSSGKGARRAASSSASETKPSHEYRKPLYTTVPARKICFTRNSFFPVTLKTISTSSASRNTCRTTGRTVTYPASSSVKRTAMVSGSGIVKSEHDESGRRGKKFPRNLAKSRNAVAHQIAECLSIDGLAFESRLRGFHDRAHLFDGIRARLGNGFGDGGVHLRFARSRRQIGLDDSEFLGFLFGQLRPVAFGKLLDGFLALLHQRLQDLNGFRLVQRANLFDFPVFDGRFDSSQDAEAQFVFRAHGVDQILLNFLGKTHRQFLA